MGLMQYLLLVLYSQFTTGLQNTLPDGEIPIKPFSVLVLL